MSSLVNIISDGRIEYKTEGRQIFIQVQTDIYICKYCTCYRVHLYTNGKATFKMNFNVQFIINRIDFILFAANVHLVDQIHWYLPCMSF